MDEFVWLVLNAKGETCGRRRTEADARALAAMLTRAAPKSGPYAITYSPPR